MGLWIRAAFRNNEARTPGANARGVTHAFASIDSSDVGRGCLGAGLHQCASGSRFSRCKGQSGRVGVTRRFDRHPGCAASDWQGCIGHKSGWMTLSTSACHRCRRPADFLTYIGMLPTRPR